MPASPPASPLRRAFTGLFGSASGSKDDRKQRQDRSKLSSLPETGYESDSGQETREKAKDQASGNIMTIEREGFSQNPPYVSRRVSFQEHMGVPPPPTPPNEEEHGFGEK